MAIEELSSTELSLLLFRVDFLPFEEAQEIKAKLKKTYGDYMDHLFYIKRIKNNYETIANCIRSRVPIKESDNQLACLLNEIHE